MSIKNKLKRMKAGLRSFKNAVKKRSKGKLDFLCVAMDLLYCKIRFKITIQEYLLYNFHQFSNRYRKHFILNYHRTKYHNIVTPAFTGSKFVFYQRIPDLYSRDILLVPYCGVERFLEFFKKHGRIIVKPDTGSIGEGIKLLEYRNDAEAMAFFESVTEDHPFVCEEFIKQHDVINQLNPYSVNTVRLVTFLDDGKVDIVAAVLKIGAGSESITDNMSLGGIGAQIDLDTGIVSSFGRDFYMNRYTHHPVSGKQIIGLQIPHWDKAKNLVKEAHRRLPQCYIYGWDIAITETGVDIVEANNRPGSRIMQVMDCVPKGHKIIPMLKKDKFKEYRATFQRNIDYSGCYPSDTE